MSIVRSTRRLEQARGTMIAKLMDADVDGPPSKPDGPPRPNLPVALRRDTQGSVA